MTNPNDLCASVMLFEDIKTDQGTELKSGFQGTLIDKFGDEFVIEFALEDSSLEGDLRFETACLSADKFAITESLSPSTE